MFLSAKIQICFLNGFRVIADMLPLYTTYFSVYFPQTHTFSYITAVQNQGINTDIILFLKNL